jgi:hypothetical protein
MSPVPRSKRSGLAIVAALVVTALLPAGALARGGDGDPCAAPARAPASGTPLAGGATTLTLDAGFAKALADNGVAAAPVAPATANEDGSIAFPITGGSLGETVDITHSGGLTFSAGTASLTATDYVVHAEGARGLLTATVGDAQVPFLKLDLSDATTGREGAATTVGGVHASLTREAAKALNATFSVSLFRGGTPVGTVAIKALPADIAVTGGATSLALDPGTAAALTSLGVSVSPIGAATANEDGSIAFPITGGTLQPAALTGTISHSGGIALSSADTRVELRKFVITLDDTPTLSAKIGGQRVDILTLDLSGLTIAEGDDGTLELGGVVGKLTAGAAAALNGAFGVTAFQEGLVLGTATVDAHLG